MARSLRNIAVLLAGGVGTRVGLDIPKQLIKIAGRPIMEHTLSVLNAHDDVDEIIIMMAPGHLDAVREIVRTGDYAKVSQILEGAGTRNETTLRALAALPDGECNVLLHDAVRPLVSERIITDCFRALDTHTAVDVAIPSADTIIEVGAENTIREIPPRANLRRGQTPQAFKATVIKEAYARAGQDQNFVATDDCTVVLRYLPEEPIWVVAGEERNMKVTEPIDVYIADKLFQLTSSRGQELSAGGSLEALRGKTVLVFGGSYGIGADIAELAEKHGADVATFSRSTTKTNVQRREDIARAGWSTPRACCRGAASTRRATRPSTWPPRSTTSPRSSSPRSSSRTSARHAAACCCSPPAPTRVDAAATACTPRRRRPR
jgi:ribitol-5-phosphate 2-dehydrogenase (NADP+) / D-ribitol-5-phosphate cytidylyltransferase